MAISLPRMLAHLGLAQRSSRSRPAKRMRAADDAAGRRRHQPQDRERGDALAAAALADHARVSPAPTSKETPSTARTTPSRVKKCVRRSDRRRASGSARAAHSRRAQPRVERVAQAVADQVHRQHGQRQERRREEHDE